MVHTNTITADLDIYMAQCSNKLVSIHEGIQILLSGGTEVDITTPTLVIIGFTITSKSLLFLYLLKGVKDNYIS